MREPMTPADIRQDLSKLKSPENWVASYIGNGVIGGCFDYVGLQFQEGDENRPDIIGDTYFVSQYHYVHGKFGMDYALPIGRLQAAVCEDHRLVEPWDPEEIWRLDQRLSVGEGVLYTIYALKSGAEIEQVQFFSQARKNLFVLRTQSNREIEFKFRPVSDINYHYSGHFETQVRQREAGGCEVYEIPTNLQTTAVALRQERGMLLAAVYSSFESSDPVRAAVAEIEAASRAGFETLLREHVQWWGRYWAESDVDIPHPLGQVWRRANYYIGCSFADKETHPPLVFGLARVQWPAYFPQDYYFAYANTLTANHTKQAAGTSSFWFDILPQAREYSERMLGLQGAVYPWTPPVFDWQDYQADGVTPNPCYYEMHNSAYVAKMCHDFYLHTLDEAYLRKKACPVIREVARMYVSLTTIAEGRAQIVYKPMFSQDEGSPKDMPNYFDALVSAEYTLSLARRLARALGDPETERMCSEILDRGYAYERLEFDDTYSVFEGDTRTENFQKHPVQLNPITFLPLPRFFSNQRVLNYHKRRYEICKGYKDATSTAWTLGQFMLASCRLRMPEELARDIDNIQRCRIMDPDYIQTFESSRRSPHFLTTIGLFMQAISETMLQTHNECAEFFPCILPQWTGETVEFRDLAAPGGFLASGTYADGFSSIEIRSPLGGEFEFAICGERRTVAVTDSEGRKLHTGAGSDRIRIATEPGGVYVITPVGT